jgi:hypothetical protein
MHRFQVLAAVLLFSLPVLAGPTSARKEFLTDKEIEKIQETHAIDARVKVYMAAAALRLKTAEERLTGKEPEAGDSLEFFTPEDMLDSYSRILKSTMMNLDDAANMDAAALARERKLLEEDCGAKCGPGEARPNRELIGKALKHLKSETEKDAGQLEILKRIAEEKKKEALWNLINSAIDITKGAHEGAEYGLTKHPAPPDREKKRNR